MPGKTKYAAKLSTHLDRPIDAACLINRAGATATMAAVGIAGVAARAVVTRAAAPEEIKVQRTGWLAIGSESFWLVDADKLLGNPKGEPYAEVDFDDVSRVELKQGRITWRATVSLVDGRTFGFETKNRGANKANPEVLELLAERCA